MFKILKIFPFLKRHSLTKKMLKFGKKIMLKHVHPLFHNVVRLRFLGSKFDHTFNQHGRLQQEHHRYLWICIRKKFSKDKSSVKWFMYYWSNLWSNLNFKKRARTTLWNGGSIISELQNLIFENFNFWVPWSSSSISNFRFPRNYAIC